MQALCRCVEAAAGPFATRPVVVLVSSARAVTAPPESLLRTVAVRSLRAHRARNGLV
jgi:hypothetical protein